MVSVEFFSQGESRGFLDWDGNVFSSRGVPRPSDSDPKHKTNDQVLTEIAKTRILVPIDGQLTWVDPARDPWLFMAMLNQEYKSGQGLSASEAVDDEAGEDEDDEEPVEGEE